MEQIGAEALPVVIREILANRGVKTAEQVQRFLYPNYETDLHDPFLLKDMEPAVQRILRAVKDNEKIVIYGDYDIDGITATAIMLDTIRHLGGATSYIPDRFEEGYGIHQDSLAKLKKAGAQLIISVDCGISSAEEIKWAAEQGLDVIVTDHHQPPEVLPQAVAVINPKRPGDRYPFKDLSGAGVAFKLAQALQQKAGKPAAGQEKWLLDLVALGTACDQVALLGENRVLAKYGLQVLTKTRRPGLRSLYEVGGINPANITTYHLNFILGPRLNAAGRLEHARASLNLILSEQPDEAAGLALKLNELNRQRRDEQEIIWREADAQAAERADEPVLVLASPNWSHGIVGIVASKLVEKWRKPALVMQILGDTAKGSGRSTGAFNLIEGLQTVSQHLLRHGGHYFAAGFTLKTPDIEALRLDLNAHYQSQGIDESVKEIRGADAEITQLADLNQDLYRAQQLLEPFGQGNPKPIFRTAGLKVARVRRVGAGERHLKLAVADAAGVTLPAIAFGLGEIHPNLKEGQTIELEYQLGVNEYLGRSDLELIVTDIQ